MKRASSPITNSSNKTQRTSKEEWQIGDSVMVLYEESKWSPATILCYVKTGIKIQWTGGFSSKQTIFFDEVDTRIRAMNDDDVNFGNVFIIYDQNNDMKLHVPKGREMENEV